MGATAPQVCGDLVGRDDPSGAQVVEAGAQVAEEFVVGQYVDGLAQSLDLPQGQDVGDVSAVSED